MEAHVSKLGDRLGNGKLGSNARSILEAGREGDNPTSADRARVKKALMRTIAASTALGASTAAGAAVKGAVVADAAVKATSIGLGIKVLGVAALALAVGAGVWMQRASSPDPVAAPAAASSVAVAATAGGSSRVAPVESADVAPPRVAITDQAAPAGPGELAPVEKPRAPSTPAAPRVAAREPVERPEEEPSAVTPAPIPAPIAAQAPAAIPAEDPLAAETRHLREAHGALQAGDPQKALALLDEQGGQLGEERAAARVLALCQLGRTAELEAARAAFLRDHPRSPLADRVRGRCAPSKTK
jgi:hypothetical protein